MRAPMIPIGIVQNIMSTIKSGSNPFFSASFVANAMATSIPAAMMTPYQRISKPPNDKATGFNAAIKLVMLISFVQAIRLFGYSL
ncbi:hypothetical protein SDC9_177017 [bioreactor metagenome]|uniref:Uncharacterized protein n=1 Tax=bioreactor metagenome TaxID=1076179 RepID=A0A645GZT5_9ZZZZ